GQSFEKVDHGAAGIVERAAFVHFGEKFQNARVVPVLSGAGEPVGFLGFDQCLVESAGRLGGKHGCQHLHGGKVFVSAGANVIDGTDDADLADAAEHDGALAVLRRFFGVGGVQLTRGPFQGAEVFADVGEGVALVEVAGNHEHGVVGLVVFAIEGL